MVLLRCDRVEVIPLRLVCQVRAQQAVDPGFRLGVVHSVGIIDERHHPIDGQAREVHLRMCCGEAFELRLELAVGGYFDRGFFNLIGRGVHCGLQQVSLEVSNGVLFADDSRRTDNIARCQLVVAVFAAGREEQDDHEQKETCLEAVKHL